MNWLCSQRSVHLGKGVTRFFGTGFALALGTGLFVAGCAPQHSGTVLPHEMENAARATKSDCPPVPNQDLEVIGCDGVPEPGP